MNTVECIIIDENKKSLETIKDYIEKIDFLQLKETFVNIYDAFSYVKTHIIDLIFIDIDFKEFEGIQILETINDHASIIIISEHEGYAVKGYELNVDNYLLKPVSYTRFIKAMDKVYNRIYEPLLSNSFQNKEIEVPKKDYIFVRTKYRMQKIHFDDVLYIQGLSNYLIIKTNDDSIFTLQKFNELMKSLPEEKFIRVHKSYVVSLDRINFIHKKLIEVGDHQIPIGESYRQIFFERLKKMNLL